MAIERFNAGEPVSARKFNNLVCALNNLCTTARNLQRGQTLSLGNNDRPRRFFGSAGCGGSGCGTCFEACVCYVKNDGTLPPFAVMRVFTTSELYINGGVWKYGTAGGTVAPQATRTSPVPNFFFFEGRYIYVRSDGYMVASCSSEYDHRFYRLIADVCTICSPTFRVNLCRQMVCVAFPKQYWVGDICQPIPRWSQGGVFRNCTTRDGKLKIYNGMVYIESPLAVAGQRLFCRGAGEVRDFPCTLHIVEGYYPVPCTTLDIPKEDLILMLRYAAGNCGSCGVFTWYWTCAEKARELRKDDVPVFGFAQQLSTEFLNNNTKGCWVGQGVPVNYSYDGSGSWGVSVPMGRSYKGAGCALCARVAQKIPEFRARPIMNFYGARVCLSNCSIHSVSGANCGFYLKNEVVLSQSREEHCGGGTEWCVPHWYIPDHIVVSYCACSCVGDGTSFSTVYKAPKQNTISETYYTNGNA